MLAVGDIAPVFAAESTKGRIQLKHLIEQGPVVLIFYPKDFTPGCTKQLCAVRDSSREYKELGATVIGVNSGSLDEHQAFADLHGYDFPIVFDENERIRKAYGVGKFLGLFLQQRTVFIVGSDGIIAYAEKGLRPTSEVVGVLTRFIPPPIDYHI
ncbi:peroxiredoxin [Cohnella faecalis]|uniref:thioredoxin-dependent peroxiredoxin n=1 Tax=Cohnella faecalis TaxID=2315694 RepID=A0A398CF98_9BACL|nr:peroxiredoxin [Cohnella faecalis]RIE00562.1 peroxiredoxin [Cohnella faecalis]